MEVREYQELVRRRDKCKDKISRSKGVLEQYTGRLKEDFGFVSYKQAKTDLKTRKEEYQKRQKHLNKKLEEFEAELEECEKTVYGEN